MIKKEINEIKKLYAIDTHPVVRICGCYVDAEKNKISTFRENFLSLPDEETFKYLDIFKKTLSGPIGKNLINLDFPTFAEAIGGSQNNILKLQDSRLENDSLLEGFYDKVIENYNHDGNYLILLIHNEYDVPAKATDGFKTGDSDEVFDFILCSICPVCLDKPGLSYKDTGKVFTNKVRNWVVNAPEVGFMFPAFNDRTTDIHSTLYFAKSDIHGEFIEDILGCKEPMAAVDQKAGFEALLKETLGDKCDMNTVKNIHRNISKRIKESDKPVVLDKNDVKSVLSESGVTDLADFDRHYDNTLGSESVHAENIINTRNFEVKSPSVSIKVNPKDTHLISIKEIAGKKCIVIEINDNVTVNGINIK